MKFSIEIPVQDQKGIIHWSGILTSFFNTIEEILIGKKRSSSLIHFYRERLDSNEKRKFLLIFSKIILQLQKAEERILPKNESFSSSSEVPERIQKLIQSFKNLNISESTKIPHQPSEVDGISKAGKILIQIEKVIHE
jgi:hypothetical protein